MCMKTGWLWPSSSFPRTLLLLTSIWFCSAVAVWGATLNVDNSDPGCSDTTGTPYCTIQAAITAASSGDTIQHGCDDSLAQ